MALHGSHALAALGAFALLGGCAQQPQPAGGTTVAGGDSILAGSVPAAGPSVAAPVEQLVLRFSPPARLDEVIVAGPEGSMSMITRVGEVGNYSLPLPGVGAGNYTVRWRATASGKEHQGSFSFAVR